MLARESPCVTPLELVAVGTHDASVLGVAGSDGGGASARGPRAPRGGRARAARWAPRRRSARGPRPNASASRCRPRAARAVRSAGVQVRAQARAEPPGAARPRAAACLGAVDTWPTPRSSAALLFHQRSVCWASTACWGRDPLSDRYARCTMKTKQVFAFGVFCSAFVSLLSLSFRAHGQSRRPPQQPAAVCPSTQPQAGEQCPREIRACPYAMGDGGVLLCHCVPNDSDRSGCGGLPCEKADQRNAQRRPALPTLRWFCRPQIALE